MRPQALSVVRNISDVSVQSSPDVVAYVTEDARRRAGEALNQFVAENGPCIVSPLVMRDLPQRDPLTMGRTLEWRQYVMPITDASDADWQDMRGRCGLEP